MIQTVLEIALSMGAVIWCFRARVSYIKLRRLQKIELHICKCLSYSNLLFFHALKRDNYEASKAMARRDNQRIEVSLRSLSSLSRTPLSLLESSLFDREPLEYKRVSGEIRPYYQIMQSLHQEAGRFKEYLLEYAEESRQKIDVDFLGWDCGMPFPEVQAAIYEEYKEIMTTYTFSKLQAHYSNLLTAIQEIVKHRHKRFQQFFSFLILIPVANRWFQLRFAPPSRERIYKESSILQSEYKELRSKTGDDKYDHLSLAIA